MSDLSHQWTKRLADWSGSDLSIVAWCRQNNAVYHQFLYWRKRLQLQTCRNLGINPQEYLEDVLRRIMGHPAQQIDELLPDLWLAAKQKNNGTMKAIQDGRS